MMRLKLILLSGLLFCSYISRGQKYKAVFPQIIIAEEDNALELLNNYLINNLDHANANLRVAIIYASRYKAVDALREREKAMALAELTKAKFFKSSLVVTEKEIRKNGDYYLGMVNEGSVPSFFELSRLISQESEAVEEFLIKLPPIYEKFTLSVEKYDAAVKVYAEVVGSYASLKELYLLHDEALELKLDKLKVSYDSTKIYFDNYLALRNQYQINAVQQSYSEHFIQVYRLDGLVTQINFLQPKISLWNYAAWVDSVNVVMHDKINVLREDLIANEKKLRAAVTEVKTSSNPETFKVVNADKSLLFNLLKYDYKNAIVPLLVYYEFQQQFIIDQHRNEYYDTATIEMDRKLAYYSDMMYASKHGDSIITEFENRFDPIQLERHRDFIKMTFGGNEEMKSFMTEEKRKIGLVFSQQISNIKDGILSENKTDSLGGIVKYRRTSIPLYTVTERLTDLPQGAIKTQFVMTSADDNVYIAGRQITDTKKRNHQIVIAKFTPELKPIWFKNIDLEIDSAGVDANHWLGDVVLTSEGIAVVIRSIALDSSKVINTLLHITETGKIKFAQRLETELFPRELSFVEASNIFVLTFFAETLEFNTKVKSDLKVIAVNGLGEELWEYDNTFSGDYQQLINTQNRFIIGGNYTVIKNKAGRTFTATSGTNAYVISLSLKGELKDIQCFVSDTSYKIVALYKVNDKNINLMGSKNEQIIINSKLEKIYSSIALK